MAYVYADYMSSAYSPAQRIQRCRDFIAELTPIAARSNKSSGGDSVDYTGVQALLQEAKTDLRLLETDPRARSRGSASQARINR